MLPWRGLLPPKGWAVCLTYNDDATAAAAVVGEIEAAGGVASAVRADVAVEADVLGAFAAAEAMGPLTALVANAGIAGTKTRVDELTVERVERILAVNVLGTIICCREAVRRLSTRHGGPGGSIVLVSSAAARLGGSNEYVDYAASKGAVDTLGLGLAKEVATEGVRVNVVRPGVIDTEIHARARSAQPDRADAAAAPDGQSRRGGRDRRCGHLAPRRRGVLLHGQHPRRHRRALSVSSGLLQGDALDEYLVSPSFLADPYETLRQLREDDPVHWSDSVGGWIVTRYDDVLRTYLEVDTYSNEGRLARTMDHLPAEQRAELGVFADFYLAKGLVHADPPDHTRIRRLILKWGFTTGQVEALRPNVRRIVDDLLDRVEADGRMDVIEDLAFVLPVTVLCDLLGVPHSDGAVLPAAGRPPAGIPGPQPARLRVAPRGAGGDPRAPRVPRRAG